MRSVPVQHRHRHGHGRRRHRGFTLIEALMAIVVLGIGLVGVMGAFGTATRASAEPVVTRQMSAIAQDLLEEIRLKTWQPQANTAAAGCARDTYNDVSDYHGYADSGICTVNCTAISTRSAYTVSVSVATDTLVGVTAAKRITITVSHGGRSYTLVGWRTDYAS